MGEYRIGMTRLERILHKTGKAVKPGKHLNRKRTLADVWGVRVERPKPVVAAPAPKRRPLPYAGYDETESNWRRG